MTRKELVNAVAEETGLTKKQTDDILVTILQGIIAGVQTDGSVDIYGFGKFKKVHREARVGYNPAKGEPMEIEARNVPVFKPGKYFKEALA